jgi:hypothetical protein
MGFGSLGSKQPVANREIEQRVTRWFWLNASFILEAGQTFLQILRAISAQAQLQDFPCC